MVEASDADELGEELALKANCSSRDYRNTIKFAEFCLNFAGLSLRQTGQLEESCKHQKAILSRPLILLSKLLFILCHYYFIKTSLISFLQFKHDVLLKQWAPKLRPGAHLLQHQCVLLEDLVEDEQVMGKIQCYRDWFSLIGHENVASTGATAIVNSYLSVFNLTFAILCFYYFKLRPIRIDLLAFMYDPLTERQRFKQKLAFFTLWQADFERNWTQRSQWLPDQQRRLHGRFFRDFAKRHSDSFVKLIWTVSHLNLVRPTCLSGAWHSRLLRVYNRMAVFLLVANGVFNVLMSLLIVIIEMVLRAQHRLALFRCQLHQPAAVFVQRGAVKLTALRLAEDIESYKVAAASSTDPSLQSLLYLALCIEFRCSLTAQSLLLMLEWTFLGYLIQINVCFYLFMYVFSFWERLTWLRQIERQLDSSFTDLKLLSRQRRELDDKATTVVQVDDPRVAALVAYLNYSMFQRYYANFRQVANLMIAQMSSCSAIAMSISYVIAQGTNSKAIILVMLGLLYLLVVSNIHLSTGSYLFSKLSSLMHKLVHIAALLGSRRLHQFRFLFMLWRRHLIDREELKKHYSLHSFGARISYDKLILLNAYSAGLFLILLRG